ncbi:hypothetical protein [Bacillus proteolyticus]|uniref:hypothetical protein n=1 Tax=Bacillus proteolyticus TaxID=2026192 RepID=UPI0013F4E181|nr:hypothetical protein [Bacillus proteolyticus]
MPAQNEINPIRTKGRVKPPQAGLLTNALILKLILAKDMITIPAIDKIVVR